MKFKRFIQVVLVGCGMLALAACSSARKHTDIASVNDMNGGTDGVQTSGVNDGANYGDAGPQDSLHKRTYYFDYDKSEVHEQDKPAIFANADYLIAHPSAKIIVEGHTDPRGSREYNVALGEHRAEAVVELLKSRGVNPGQIRVVSYGAERLAAPGHTENDYQLDRRAVIVYTHR